MIARKILQHIENDFGKGKIIVMTGARQVGKTTLYDAITSKVPRCLLLNCDNYDDRQDLEAKTSTELRQLIADYPMVVIDEAQRVNNIGLTLKMMADLHTEVQILVTGSSSLELADSINEAATGRCFEYNLYPFSTEELIEHTSEREEKRLLEQRLIYGMYPDVVLHPADARRILNNLSNNYLYKDLLGYRGVKKPDLLQRLVRALALQVGSEVSYNELSNTLGVDKETIASYIDLLEKCFVVFRLTSYSRNMRSEIKKGKKIYFYDNGIRNALISNFSPMELRNDKGALWENFIVSERLKQNAFNQRDAQLFFWRTTDQQEVDLIEYYDGQLTAFELKWRKARTSPPASFARHYPEAQFQIINQDNYISLLKSKI